MLKYIIVATALASSPALGQEDADTVPSEFAIALMQEREANNSLGAAPSSNTARQVSSLGLALIIDFEGSRTKKDPKDPAGYRHVHYDDPAGYCTIGYGRLIKKAKCKDVTSDDLRGGLTAEDMENGITEDRAVEFLKDDLSYARVAVTKSTVYPSDGEGHKKNDAIDTNIDQYSALVSFVFNVGEGNLQKSTLLRRMQQDRNDLAAREFLRWIKSGGKIFQGLIDRRECEQTLFRGELAFNAEQKFSRSGCSSMGIANTSGGLVDITAGETSAN